LAANINGQDYNSLYRGKNPIKIDGKCYLPSYRQIIACDGGPDLNLAPANISQEYFYFTQAIHLKDGTLIFSPQQELAAYFPDDGGATRQVKIGRDVWRVGDQIVGPYGPVNMDGIEGLHVTVHVSGK
jgi:hypothetical protein